MNNSNPLLQPVVISFRDKVSILINLFIKPEIKEQNLLNKSEFIAASRLIKKCPDFDFFYEIPELTNKLNSLFGLLSKKVIDLDGKYADFLLAKSKNKIYTLSDSPIIELKIENKKPSNLMEFLNEK